MDPLAWLGLRKKRARLAAVHDHVRAMLPHTEPVVVRYIVVVSVLLARIVHADGRMMECERQRLAELFGNIDHLPPDGVETLCEVLNRQVPKMGEDEIDACYSEVRSLCDAEERVNILRLLARQASADGRIDSAEQSALTAAAEELGVALELLEEMEVHALAQETIPLSGPSHRGLPS